MLRVLLVWTVILTGFVPLQSLAQQERLREDICKDCTLNLQLRVTLGDNGIENPFSAAPSSVSADRSGRYYVTDFQNRSQIFVFDARGHPLKPLGRRGLGPNEFEFLTCAAVRADSLFAADLYRGVVVIDLHSSQEARTISFNRALTQFFAANDSVFMAIESIPMKSREAAFTFHNVNARSGTFRPAGEVPLSIPGTSIPYLRTGAPSADGNVWLGHKAAYQLEKWNLANRRLRHFVREVDWFRPYTTTVRRSPSTPPHPQIIALKEIAPDLLAVVINRASPRWQQDIGGSFVRDGRETWDFGNSKLYESVIEIIDVSTASVIYRTTIPKYLIGFIEGTSDLYASRTVDGIPLIDVLTFSFTRPRK